MASASQVEASDAAPAASCASQSGDGGLVRALRWTGPFWLAAGVPPLVLFSLGGIAGVAGNAFFPVFVISTLMGFSQSFTYAEMAGMFHNKSGGASVYGAMAWLRYSKFIAPLSVWCNWFAWSPVLSLGCSVSANYMLNLAFPGHVASDGVEVVRPAIHTWKAFSVHVPGLGNLNFNMTFFFGLVQMLFMFAVQHRGIKTTARLQKVLAIVVLVPLLLAGLVPLVTGAMHWDHFEAIVPPSAPNSGVDGAWDMAGWTLIMGAMYMAAWTTYAFETAVCYTSELKDPARDTVKSILSAGLSCMAFFLFIPLAFQGVMDYDALLQPAIVDGTGIAEALGSFLGGNWVVTQIYVILMILALFLSIMTALAGSSRTLYQGSKDGWLPKYLATVNSNGAPTGAMLTDLVFNVFLLALASDPDGYYFVMAVSNVGYITFNFLNLNAGWIHRLDSGDQPRAWRAPTVLIAFNTLLSFVNAVFMGAGAKVWGYSNALWAGWGFAALIIPVFAFRHYVQDGGVFPEDVGSVQRKAGILPYICLVAGVIVVVVSDRVFQMPQ
mmetsp:Transcript_105075/g.322069  ORF Transcript_105075/g.322069 Transcript_105075/m.322069 type:complete len:552 (-) Transcript_105075:417-2072(-)